MKNQVQIYPQLIEKITDWPIYKLYDDRSAFVHEINESTLNALLERYGDEIDNVIARTVYLEQIRLKENPWKVDPPNEKQFWKRVKKELSTNSKHREDVRRQRNKELLRRVINRYSEEIAGKFKVKTLKFARKFLKGFFRRLLNTAAGRNHRRIFGTKHNLYERLPVYGDLEKIRKTFANGTVVVVPTHFSNLDSILIGYALDSIVGLPSFSYGAGLNLYESELTAYFMTRLGAYRVDRRKKNPIYLETLKQMSSLSLQKGVNSLFFPGGTRSRNGSLETQLKLGLLNSLVEAQRSIYQNGKDQKIIVVPLIISYHFVLEAKFLINSYLRRKGQEKFLYEDEFRSMRKIFQFIWRVFSEGSSISLSFGAPLDVLGNEVSDTGQSFDERGSAINIQEYFTDQGEIVHNRQRESVYTQILSSKIIESYHHNNVVLSSHLVSFAAFEVLKKLNEDLDIFGLIRLPSDDFIFPKTLFYNVTEQILEAIHGRAQQDKIKMSRMVAEQDLEALIAHGIKQMGIFHNKKPLRITRKGDIVSEDYKFLYYYHNRLASYELEKGIVWKEALLSQAMELVS